jgi:hypothetical protein
MSLKEPPEWQTTTRKSNRVPLWFDHSTVEDLKCDGEEGWKLSLGAQSSQRTFTHNINNTVPSTTPLLTELYY